MQPDMPYSPSPFSVPCSMCSCFMFVFGGFFMIPGFILAFAVRKEPDLFIGIFCIGIACIILLLATCCFCFVRKERKKELKYMMNNSSMAQRLDGIEMRLAQQSNTPVQILTPPETRVTAKVLLYHGIITKFISGLQAFDIRHSIFIFHFR